jgi:trigger factor
VNAEGREGGLGRKQSMEEIREKVEKEQAAPLPELTDEIVKTLGQPGQFETVADFKTKLREHLEIEKKNETTAKHRAAITDAIIEKTDLTLPKILIESEQAQMWAQMQDDIGRNDLKMDDYLAHIKKTKEELFAEWQPAAEKRAKLQLVLNEIARVREMKPDETEVATQAAQLMERFKDADKQRVTLYVASMLMNEEVMKELEGM